MRIVILALPLSLLAMTSCFPGFNAKETGSTSGAAGGAGGTHAAGTTSALTATDAVSGTGQGSTGSEGGAGGACPIPTLTELTFAAGEGRFVADDLPTGVAMTWSPHAGPATPLNPGGGTAVPTVAVSSFGCHKGVRLGDWSTTEHWYHEATVTTGLTSHTLMMVVKVHKIVNPSSANVANGIAASTSTGGGNVGGILFLGGTNSSGKNSVIGIAIPDPALPQFNFWYGGMNEADYVGTADASLDTTYVVAKTYDAPAKKVTGYLNGVSDETSTLVLYSLPSDVGLGGRYFATSAVQDDSVTLESFVGEMIVTHTTLPPATVQQVSCELGKAYGATLNATVCP